MHFFVGTLDGAYNLSAKKLTNEPADFFEITLNPPLIRFDIAGGRVYWESCVLIDAVREGDIVTFNREEYEREVRTQIAKWKKYPPIKRNLQEKFYKGRVALLTPYFLLIDELEKQQRVSQLATYIAS